MIDYQAEMTDCKARSQFLLKLLGILADSDIESVVNWG